MEYLYSQVASYLRKRPITFPELKSVLIKRRDPSFIVVTGKSKPFSYSATRKDDIAEETRLASVIVYDAPKKIYDVYYRFQTVYNNESETLTTVDGVSSTAEVKFEKALSLLEEYLQDKEWLPSEELLEEILTMRVGERHKLPKDLLKKLKFPNEHVAHVLQRSQIKDQPD